MPGGHYAFFGLTAAEVVRSGADIPGHGFVDAHIEMLLQVCRDYPGVPDPRTLKAHEIRFFYEGLRPELKEHTKPKRGK